MHFRIFIVATILCKLATGVPCNCGLGPGYSFHETEETRLCHHDGDTKLVIRPDPYLSPSVQERIEANSIQRGDRIVSSGSVHPPQKDCISLCSCANTIVTPAHVPPPPCRKCSDTLVQNSQSQLFSSSSRSTSSSSYSGSSSSNSQGQLDSGLLDSYISGSSGSIIDGRGGHRCHHDELNQVPADPVSIAIAVKQHLRNENVPRNSLADRDLAFGFQKLPAEVHHECRHHNAREGSLNSINGQILDLKLPRATVTKSVDEEAFEELLAEQEGDLEETGYDPQIRHPSLADFGYINGRVTDPKFVPLKGERRGCGDAMSNRQTCRDGFQPGKVILKEEVKLPNCNVRERETVCAGGVHHRRLWSSGQRDTVLKHVGLGCRNGCLSGCQCEYRN